jgi:hypothetical protein
MTNLNNLTQALSVLNVTSPTALNILNISAPTGEECMICREELECMPCYTLPECNHIYHTNCLISWFRNGDPRCPYCGNKGINNVNADITRQYTSKYYALQYKTQALCDIKKFIFLKKYDTNKRCLEIRKQFEKIKVLEENYRNESLKMRELQQSLKDTPALFSEAKKKIMSYRSNKWKITKQIRDEKFKIVANSYIIPLIIPRSVEI